MNNSIPGKPRIINNNMNLPLPKLRRLLHQLGDILAIRDIADDGKSTTRLDGVDRVRDGIGFFCWTLETR